MTEQMAEKLRSLRKAKGLSKAELATKLNIMKDDVEAWEENEKEPTPLQWVEIAKVYSTTVESLQEGEERSYFKYKAELESDAKKAKSFINKANYPIFITLLYLCMGFFMHLWHPSWLLFLTIPIYYIPDKYRTPRRILTSPVALVLIYLILGFYCHLWHPGWLIFFAIPLFSTFFDKD